MKQNYLAPSVEVVEIAIEDCVLQSSLTPNSSSLEDLHKGVTL